MAEKMTQKQMFALIAEKCADDEMIVKFCEQKIQQLDKRKNTPRKANPEVEQRRQEIVNFLLGNGAAPVKEIADALGYTSPKVTGALRGLVNNGTVEVIEPEKKSAPKLYAVVEAAADEDDGDEF